MNSEIIKNIQNGVFRVSKKDSRSKVWGIFSQIEKTDGTVIDGVVMCDKCNNILKYNGKQTSNLIRHKCYSEQSCQVTLKKVSHFDKENFLMSCSEWIAQDSRPFSIVDGEGFKKLVHTILNIGTKYGSNLDVVDMVPDSTTISRRMTSPKPMESAPKGIHDQDLKSLLTSWDLDQHYEHFRREKITLKHLKLMQPKHVDKLFQYLPLGDQILFEHHLNNDFNAAESGNGNCETNHQEPLRTMSRKSSIQSSILIDDNSQDNEDLLVSTSENMDIGGSDTELKNEATRPNFTISTSTQKFVIHPLSTPRIITPAAAVPVARHSHASTGVTTQNVAVLPAAAPTLPPAAPATAPAPSIAPFVIRDLTSRQYPTETSCRYDLKQILTETNGGQIITNYYNKHQHFKEEHRTSLINVIARYIDAGGCTLTLAESYDLEAQIVDMFPTEKAEFYRTSKRGRIYNKVSNMKSVYRKLTKETDDGISTASPAHSTSSTSGIKQEEFEEEYNDCIIGEMRAKAVANDNLLEFWKTTQAMRFKSIEEFSDLQLILDKWPEYKEANAIEYVSLDFYTKFPSATKFSQIFIERIKKLEKFLFTKVSPSSSAFKYLQIYQKATKESQYLIILWVMHQLFPPHQFTTTSEFGVKRKKRYSIADSQNASICIRSSLPLIDMFLETKETATPPMLLVVGDLGRNIQQIFVYFEGIRYPMESVLQAQEMCLHLYFLFNIAFPEEAQLCYNFMQSYFLNIEPDLKNSKIYTTINELNAY